MEKRQSCLKQLSRGARLLNGGYFLINESVGESFTALADLTKQVVALCAEGFDVHRVVIVDEQVELALFAGEAS